LEEEGFINNRKCIFDKPFNGDYRPDIFCNTSSYLVGEVRVSSENIQGPHQLKVYAEALRNYHKVDKIDVGVLAYGTIIEGTREYIEESIMLHDLKKLYDEMYLINYRGKKKPHATRLW